MATFKSSARSIDMLGRQQIAGVPTAVSEIFKNAYDAYATHVRGDYYPSLEALVIRDDGIGMSRSDFETRWLTVGTESKVSSSSLPPLSRPPHLSERRQMGEKGIGRLAIATIGPQLLVVTRGRDTSGRSLDHVVVALIQWSMFEIPGITLDEVAIPIREISDESELTPELLKSMAAEIEKALVELGSKVSRSHADRIRDEIRRLYLDAARLVRHTGPNPFTGSGTAFVVSPVSPDVDVAMQLDASKQDDFAVSEFQRFLLGFTNSITPSVDAIDFKTQFFRHEKSGANDLIERSTYFWDSTDFRLTDHTVDGEFDELGTFRGQLRIYDQEAVDIVQPWVGGRGRTSAAGPFKIKFGYVQGKAAESSLQPGDFAMMTARLEGIGGLYVYRDGIRVLPYGNADYDYLEIEKRRSLKAASYYFSYRRMFGAISVESTRNAGLQEKAGREGFRDNAAYRDFRSVLKEFLIQLAASYFSSRAGSSELWHSRRQEIAIESRQLKEERTARDSFAKELSNAIAYVESGEMFRETDRIVRQTRETIRRAKIGAEILDKSSVEAQVREGLREVERKFIVARPPGVALSVEIERDWHSYLALEAAVAQSFEEATVEAESAIDSLDEDGSHASAQRQEPDGGVDRSRRVSKIASESRARVVALSEDVRSNASAAILAIVAQSEQAVIEFEAELDLAREGVVDSFQSEHALNRRLERLADSYAAEEKKRIAQISEWSENDPDASLRLRERILDLEGQIEDNLELLQLGQAVQVVSHEFEASITSVRAGLRRLDPWARSTPRLQPVVKDLRAAFGHLDGYLRLFTPLQRRLQNADSLISGRDLENFLLGVFGDRLQREDVELSASPEFREFRFRGFPSTFYPVFVNLVDNALHWVLESSASRVVNLGLVGMAMFVSDSGPGVRVSDSAYIFERGFSRRRSGRGLGLSLARELLDRDGWDLSLEPSPIGATFVVSPRSEEVA